MYKQLRNNTCYDQFIDVLDMPTEEHKRVYPFLNPEIVYNDVQQQYEYNAENCIIPNQALSSFNINGDSCILKSNAKPTYLTKTANGCSLKVTDQDTYKSKLDILQTAIDYDYLEKISKLEAECNKKRQNIDNIQKNIDKKTVYMNALRRGSVIAGDDISKFQNKKKDLVEKQWLIIYNKYNSQKSIFEKEQDNYNKLVDKLSAYIDLVNNKEYSVMLFEDCWWGGYHPVITLPKNQPSITHDIRGFALSGIGGFPNKIKIVLTDANGSRIDIKNAISCLVDVNFNDRASKVTIERINNEVNNFEKQSDLGDTDEIKNNL